MKKNLKGLAICLTLCFTMLCGGIIITHAVTPVCGGDHNFCKVRDAGRVNLENGQAHVHWHGDHWCAYILVQDMKLERCYCGMERVVPEGGAYTVHESVNL